jgi:hypothetical protein
MDEDIIDAVAMAFAEQMIKIENDPMFNRRHYIEQCLDDMVAMAIVIHDYEPTYDLRHFYKNAGYPEPYPVHPID